MDRNFCVTGFLKAIHHQNGFFIARHHKGLTLNCLNPSNKVQVKTETGRVRGFTAEIREGETALPVRVIRASFKKPTRDGRALLMG